MAPLLLLAGSYPPFPPLLSPTAGFQAAAAAAAAARPRPHVSSSEPGADGGDGGDGGDGAEDEPAISVPAVRRRDADISPYRFNYCCHGSGVLVKASNGFNAQTQFATQRSQAHNGDRSTYQPHDHQHSAGARRLESF